MRPSVLNEYRPSLINRFKLLGMRVLFGQSALDAGRAAFYRPESFWKPYYALEHEILRGKSSWSIGERELFAAAASKSVQCRFCTVTHSAFASAGLGQPALVESLLGNNRPEGVNEKLGAVIAFVEKLSLRPQQVVPEDIERLRQEGLKDSEIEEAVIIAVLLSIGVRLADTMDFEVPTPNAIRRATPIILRFGYLAYT